MRRFIIATIATIVLAIPQLAYGMASSSIPTKIPVYWAQTASNSFATCPMPTPSQIPITAGRASWTDGFPPLTFLPAVSGGVPPFGQDFNGVLCQISQWTRWFNAGAGIPYDATFQSAIGGYPKGAIVPSSVTFGIVWVSTVENNTSNPDTGGAGWSVYNSTFSTSTINSASQTYTSSQCGLLISRSNAGSPMADTFPGTSPGVLPNNCPITVTNNDASALLTIAVGAGAIMESGAIWNGFIYLGPGQTAVVQSNGSNYWATRSPGRAKLAANTSIYFGNSGNDTANSGAASSVPFLTISRAWNFVQNAIDMNGFVLTIQGADNYASPVTYSSVALNLTGTMVGQSNASSLIIQGSLSTPANAILSGVSGSVTINGDMGAKFQVQGFDFIGGAQQIRSASGSVINIQTDIFGAVTPSTGSQITAVQNGVVQIVGNYTVNGNGASHYNANANGVVTTPGPSSPTVTLTGSPAFSVAFVVAQSNGTFFADLPITFTGSPGATTVRYAAGLNGVINTAGGGPNYFPGTAAGTTNTGGQYN